MISHGVLVLAGPTASGKTALALELAERFDAEIVGADSRQIYRGMPIGTAAPSAEERARVPHHLIEFLDPSERYSAARFTEDALSAIEEIMRRGRRALVVGGTGFYLRALCGDVDLSPAYDPALRERLAREARLHSSETLHAWLAARDPARVAAIAPTDPYRIVRALEIALTRESFPGATSAPRRSLRTLEIPTLKIAIDVDDAVLDARIAARVDRMLAAGFVDEAGHVGAEAVASDAVGYPQALAYARGFLNFDELRMLLIRATKRYARRQRTWFRGEPEMRRVAPDEVAHAAATLPGWA
jgi:tRNA dimethylallyltransferase